MTVTSAHESDYCPTRLITLAGWLGGIELCHFLLAPPRERRPHSRRRPRQRDQEQPPLQRMINPVDDVDQHDDRSGEERENRNHGGNILRSRSSDLLFRCFDQLGDIFGEDPPPSASDGGRPTCFGAAPPVAGSSAELRQVASLPCPRLPHPPSTAVRAGRTPEHALLAAILADREGEEHDRFLEGRDHDSPNTLCLYRGRKSDLIKEGDRLRAIERAVRAEVRKMPEDVWGSALAKAAIALGRRLDDDPSDSAAALLNRELRMTLADLYRKAPEDVTDEVDRFLARIATADERNAAH
jgi:hypothetical protein